MINELVRESLIVTIKSYCNDYNEAIKDTNNIMTYLLGINEDTISHKDLDALLVLYGSDANEVFYTHYGLLLYRYEYPEEFL